jgi:hypothetical protein
VIEFVVTLLVAIALWALVVTWKVRRMNDDPKQRELVGLLLTAGQMYRDDPVTATSGVRAYFRAQGRNNIEIAWRMAHAVSFVEHAPAHFALTTKTCSLFGDRLRMELGSATGARNVAVPMISPCAIAAEQIREVRACPLWVIRYRGGQGSKLSDVCLAPKATDNRLETACREGPISRHRFPHSNHRVRGLLEMQLHV